MQVDLLRNELTCTQRVVCKAAKVLKGFECCRSQELLQSQQSEEWKRHNQQQLFRFHFRELTDQIHSLQQQVNEKQSELTTLKSTNAALIVIKFNPIHFIHFVIDFCF